MYVCMYVCMYVYVYIHIWYNIIVKPHDLRHCADSPSPAAGIEKGNLEEKMLSTSRFMF